jgi:hypothetical protein
LPSGKAPLFRAALSDHRRLRLQKGGIAADSLFNLDGKAQLFRSAIYRQRLPRRQDLIELKPFLLNSTFLAMSQNGTSKSCFHVAKIMIPNAENAFPNTQMSVSKTRFSPKMGFSGRILLDEKEKRRRKVAASSAFSVSSVAKN